MLNKENKPYELTEEHKAQLKPWADKWIANALSTKPMTLEDKEICEAAVHGIYKAAKQTPPKHTVFVSSPFVFMFAGAISVVLYHLKKADKKTYNKIEQQLKDGILNTPSKSIVERNVKVAVLESLGLDASKVPEITTETYTKRDDKWYICHNPTKELDNLLGLDGNAIDCSKRIWNIYQGGNQWSGYDSFISFFRHIAKLDETHGIDFTDWAHWENLSLHSGPRIVHEDFCMISNRPKVILQDAQFRPHNSNGPYLEYADGTSLYCVQGVRVPPWIVNNKERITPELIDKEPNAEVRRIMLEQYGMENYLLAGKYEVLDEDTDQFGRPRRLLRRQNGNDEPIVRLEVVNSSPEEQKLFEQLKNISSTFIEDGKAFKRYYLPVHFELKPLPNVPENATREQLQIATEALEKAKPQKMTCHNAVASTFGMTGKEYGKQGQKRQGDVLISMISGKSLNDPFRES